jgi:hypothetical protein
LTITRSVCLLYQVDLDIIPDIKNVKNLSESQQKEKEGEFIGKNHAHGPTHFIGRKREIS